MEMCARSATEAPPNFITSRDTPRKTPKSVKGGAF
jgi:hypothetical protein